MDNVALFFWVFGLARKSPLLDNLMVFGADYLIFFTFLLMALLAAAFGGREKRVVFTIAAGIAIEFIIRKAIYFFYFEPRPFVTYPITTLIRHAADPSFPSGHTTIMAVLTFSYYFCKSKFWPLFLFLTVWVGFARIYVGVHYPLDIIGGIAVGFISAFLAWQITKLQLLQPVFSGLKHRRQCED